MIDIVLSHCTLQHKSKIRIQFHQVRQCFLIVKQSLYMFWPMMAIIGMRPTLQKKCFTCIMCKCCLVRVKKTSIKICFVKSNRSFRLIRIFMWIPVIVTFLHSWSSVLCWSCVYGHGCGVVCDVFWFYLAGRVQCGWKWLRTYSMVVYHITGFKPLGSLSELDNNEKLHISF
jgi:hypothetical protein